MRNRICLILVSFWMVVFSAVINTKAIAAQPSNGDYDAYPTFLSSTVMPNVLVILDTSTSMQKFSHDSSYSSSSTYDGYFDTTKTYAYDSSNKYFYEDASGTWKGSALNYICMRRIDTAKHVLTGGRTWPSDSTILYGTPYINKRGYHGGFQTSRNNVESSSNDYTFNTSEDTSVGGVNCPSFYKGGSTWYVRVKVSSPPRGIIQELGDETAIKSVNFGFEIFNPGQSGSSWNQGGRVLESIGATCVDIVSSVNEQDLLSDPISAGIDQDTPLAESLWTAVGYFAQKSGTSSSSGPMYDSGCYTVSNAWDPFYSASGDVSCVKSFIILVSDGDPISDGSVPSSSPNLRTSHGVSGQYLDDVAYWMHTNDIRSSSFGIDITDTQTIGLYTVSTFGGGATLLESAARYGGFEDSNGNNLPDLTSEYDEDNDGDADNYFEASSSAELKDAISSALVDILEKAAAASAVSVLSTTSEGEGIMVQAFFQPAVENPDTGEDIKWLGYIQSLWLDDMGNMREDTNQNRILEPATDKVVTFTVVSGDTKANVFDVSTGNEYPDTSGSCGGGCSQIDVDTLNPVWEAGKILSDMENTGRLGYRHIFTYIDKNNDGVVDDSGTQTPFDSNDEVIRLTSASTNVSMIKPYLGVKDNTGGDWNYLDTGTTSTDHTNRATNLIKFTMGLNTGFSGTTDIRSRLVEGSSPTTTPRSVWPLGDTVNSSPVSIAAPPDNFGVIYGDSSYDSYYNQYRDREMVVYVGGNDGMLHAITSWKFNSTTKEFEDPIAGTLTPDSSSVGQYSTEVIGTEIWAYVPQALLPHLKWLANPDYTHVYYVDLKPRIVDAKIFTADSVHPGGWGTILIGGLNYGGGKIDVTDDFDYNNASADTTRTFNSSFFAIDITEPRKPTLLWERTYDDLGFTTSVPVVTRVKDEWFAIFGSGPTGYDGSTTNNGHVYVVDLKTGVPYQSSSPTKDWLFDTGTANAFMGSPVALDYGLNFNVDAVYIPETSGTITPWSWDGAMYKIVIPWWGTEAYGTVTSTASQGQYSDDPLSGSYPWLFSRLVSSTGPISVPPALSVDIRKNVWVYFGTGRYITDDDKTDTTQQYFYGIKDPFFNKDLYEASAPVYYTSYANTKTVSPITDLFSGDLFSVVESGRVYDYGTSTVAYSNFNLFIYFSRTMDGWYRSLGASGSGERSLSKAAVLGGVVLLPTFDPNNDICGFGGESFLYGLYFETGTAYPRAIFENCTQAYSGDAAETEVLDRTSLGSGMAASAGIHIGKQAGARGLIQQSTGVITDIDIAPVFELKSGITSWQHN